MCGIAGFSLAENENVNAVEASMALLRQIQARGRDATGAAWVKYDKQAKKASICVSKAPVRASMFEPYLRQMSPKTSRVILHTRMATQGSPQNNLNNHPIVAGRIVGIHNGVLHNDDAIFEHLKGVVRKGKVDSEAAFALLNHTEHRPVDVLESVKGRAALAWFDASNKRPLHLARVSGSPLFIGQTAEGSLFFASTMPLLVQACEDARIDLRYVEEVDEKTYLRVERGEIKTIEAIGQSVKQIAS
jgi:glucosamine 6-phosphate synthetase-like amidotransferase/phosphosugar isomerase protein